MLWIMPSLKKALLIFSNLDYNKFNLDFKL